MSYALNPKNALMPQLVQAAHAQLGRAAHGLDAHQGLDPEAVHEARKAIKKARAILRLGRQALGPESAARLERQLGDLGRQLGRWRDADALGESVVRLRGEGAIDAVLAATFAAVSVSVEKRRDELRQRLVSEGHMCRRSVLKGLADARVELVRWPLPESAAADLACGVKKTFRKARAAYHEARDSGDPELLHDWRKRTKTLANVARLFGKAWPEFGGARRERLSQLADALGHEHDLALLDAFVAREPESWPEGTDLLSFRSRLATARTALREEAFRLAKKTLRKKHRPRRTRRVLKDVYSARPVYEGQTLSALRPQVVASP